MSMCTLKLFYLAVIIVCVHGSAQKNNLQVDVTQIYRILVPIVSFV